MASGTLTGLQHRHYNGGWSSWTNVGSAAQYIGSSSNHPYCLKFTVPNDNIINATLTFNFNIVKGSSTTGSSGTITWDIRTAGPSTGTSKQGSSIKSGEWSISGITASNQKKTLTTSVISSLSKGTTYYLWLTSNVLFQAFKDSSYYSGSISYTNYTACSAPSSVSASGIVTPSGTFTVSWSGASGGTNNAISGYRVYYKVGATPTTSSYTSYKDVDSTSTYGSTSFTLNSASRGSEIICGVVTHGSAGSSYYSNLKSGGSVRVNDLPNQPTLSKSNQTIPSTSNGITVTATAGSDSYSASTPTVYYSTSASGTKTKYSSGILINPTVGTSSTYYFWTYDGLEYSSSKSITVTKNVAPTIVPNTTSQVTTYNALGGTGEIDSQLGYAYAIRPNITTNKAGTLKITVEMANSNTTTSTSSYGYSYSLPDYSITSASNINLNTYDIHTAAVNKFSEETRQITNIKWRLKFVLNDGCENSSPAYYPADGQFYTIARAPSLSNSYNQFADSNVPGTKTGQIWREARMKFYNDESVTTISATATADNIALSQVSAVSTISTDNNYRYVDITLPDGIKGESAVQITISLTNSTASITKKVVCNLVETLEPDMSEIIHGAPVIYPFNPSRGTGSAGSFEIKMAWPFTESSTLDSSTLQSYNCSTTVKDAIKFIHASDTSSSNEVNKELVWIKSGDVLSTTMERTEAYGWEHELGYNSYVGIQTYYCQLQITNLFGKTFKSPWLSRTFNFNEKAQNLVISKIEWAETNDETAQWTEFQMGTNGNIIQESLYLRFFLQFGLFTEDDITINLNLTNDVGTKVVLTQRYQASELYHATNMSIASNEIQVIYGPIGNISTNTTREWKFEVINNGGSEASSSINMLVQRQTAPQIKFTNCNIRADGVLEYTFVVEDNGLGNTVSTKGEITNYLYYNEEGTSSQQLSAPSSGNVWTGTISPPQGGWGWTVQTICVQMTSKVDTSHGQCVPKEISYLSEYLIVYNVNPTVAYRKNRLGINTTSLNNEAVLTIQPTTGANKIVFTNGRAGNAQKIITLDLNDTEAPSISLTNGSLVTKLIVTGEKLHDW